MRFADAGWSATAGLTPARLVSQLAHRVFGPPHPERTRIVLDYHRLLDHPVGSLVVVAARQP